jgi:adenylate kinase
LVETKKKKTIVVGIPGVGKTTVVEKTNEILNKKGIKSTVAVFGTLMFEHAKKIGITNRDEIRKLSMYDQQKLQEQTVDELSNLDGDVIMVDTHLFVRTKSGYYPGLPQSLLEKLRPDNLILIIADAIDIAARRGKDRTRSRDSITIEEINQDLNFSISMISTISVLTGAPFALVRNAREESLQAALDMVQFIEK